MGHGENELASKFDELEVEGPDPRQSSASDAVFGGCITARSRPKRSRPYQISVACITQPAPPAPSRLAALRGRIPPQSPP